MSAEESREELARRVDAIEAGYEMMLAYAAQGLPTDQGAASGAQLRVFLERFEQALTGIASAYREYAQQLGLGPQAEVDNFLKVLARDAEAAQAGLRLVLGQSGISSQLVDNLNASIHVRALLTDIFLIRRALPPAELGLPAPAPANLHRQGQRHAAAARAGAILQFQ